jgi:hypothetical protein
MSPDPFIATDNIQFTLTLNIDRCLFTTIDDQFLPDQTYKIDMNSPPTSLTYREFEDWVTRDQAASPPHVCGPRKYELSTIAGGAVTESSCRQDCHQQYQTLAIFETTTQNSWRLIFKRPMLTLLVFTQCR